MAPTLPSKTQWRTRFQEAVAALSPQEKSGFSMEICQAMEGLEVWSHALFLLGFVPRSDEPDIRPLLGRALELGKTVGLPAYNEQSKDYGVRQVTRLEKDLVPGKFGILEPTKQCPMLPLNRLDLILVPGVGFGTRGCRIGRGHGFYDRLLGQAVGFKCGVAFDCQVETGLPTEPHDIGMNGILTPTRWLQCLGASGTR